MILSWMLYATVVALLFAVAGRLLEPLAVQRGLPARWLWAAALAAPLLLPPLLALRRADPPPPVAGVPAAPAPTAAAAAPSAWTGWSEWTEPIASLPEPARRIELDLWLARGWALASAAIASVFCLGYGMLLRRRREWESRLVDGREVWVSRDVGPAVVGFLPGRVVLPRWLVAARPEERAIALAHEEEHIRAGDSGLLLAALLVAVALPWNPGLWWSWRSLRRAVEVDCDQRVLRRGVDPLAYGRLLVQVMEHGARHRLVLAALPRSVSFLERRVEIMLTSRSRRFSARAGGALLLAGGCVFAACQVEQPRSPVPATGATYTAQADGSLVQDSVPATVAATIPASAPLASASSAPTAGAEPLTLPQMMKLALERYFPNVLTQDLGPDGVSVYLVGDARGELVRTAIDTERRAGECMGILQERLGSLERSQIDGGGCGRVLGAGEAGPNQVAFFWAYLKPGPGEENAAPTGPFLFSAAARTGRPEESMLRAAIERQFPGTLQAGLPYGEALWFVADAAGRVLHSGKGLEYGSSAVAKADLERRLPGVRIGPVLMSSSVKDAQGKGIDLTWATVAEPGSREAQPASGPFTLVRTYVVTSPLPDQEVTIRLEGEATSNPRAFRVSGKFTADGNVLRARTPFTFIVVSDAPFAASLTTAGGELDFATQWEGRESRFRASALRIQRDASGGPIRSEVPEVTAAR